MTTDEKYRLLITKVGSRLKMLDKDFDTNMKSGDVDIINNKLKIIGVVTSQISNKYTMLKTTFNCCKKLQKQYPLYTLYIFNIYGNNITFDTFNNIQKKMTVNDRIYYDNCLEFNEFTSVLKTQQEYLKQAKTTKFIYVKLITMLKKLDIDYNDVSINNIKWEDIKISNKEHNIYYKNKHINSLNSLIVLALS